MQCIFPSFVFLNDFVKQSSPVPLWMLNQHTLQSKYSLSYVMYVAMCSSVYKYVCDCCNYV